MLKKGKSNIDSPFHNGHKYEPLSIMHYEFDFKTTVGEFGCKAHTKFPFLRASPDGINIAEKSNLFGRLVEVKTLQLESYQEHLKGILDTNAITNGSMGPR